MIVPLLIVLLAFQVVTLWYRAPEIMLGKLIASVYTYIPSCIELQFHLSIL